MLKVLMPGKGEGILLADPEVEMHKYYLSNLIKFMLIRYSDKPLKM